MVNRFVLNAVSYHGKGVIQEIPGIVRSKGFKKAFIATDPDLVKFGVTKKITDLLDANGMDYTVNFDIQPNPTIENVQHDVKAYKESGADSMITVGGGSAWIPAKPSALS
ncbi:iron-containing alcohol dehydrogenase, partial [uncultured Allobaculum sp.]|uniref:iron-containing alcohol dehydrogenase n=1 Tax=uncultured Allobaculum sp. TaxID=1187017 RepID=UPI0026EC94C4